MEGHTRGGFVSLGRRVCATRGIGVIGRVGAAVLVVLFSACGDRNGAHAGAPDSGPGGAGIAGSSGGGGRAGAPGDLPELTLEFVGEITLGGFTGSAEDLVVDQDGITIVTLEGSGHFTPDGHADSDGISPQRAGAGADAFRTNWFATVRGGVLAYYGWELMLSPLEGTISASGVAVERDESGAFRHLYVTDSGTAKIEEHSTTGGALSELAVPGADLQGIAIAPEGGLFALDARQRRLVRATEDLSALDSAAPLPNLPGNPSGMHWFESLLYVCFRDSNRVAVLRLGPAN